MGSHKFQKVSKQVQQLYLQGMTKVMIAEALGMKESQIAYILYTLLRIHEDRPRKMSSTNLVDSMPKEQVNRVITLASWGYNFKEIAEDTSLPYNRVQVLVKEAKEKNLIKKMV
jgi:DNA-binding transcriptional regulator LsrR (DeoR family)